MSEELRPCPFCGGPGEHREVDEGDHRIVCEDCGAMCETMGDASGAARAWQGRPVEDELRVEVERLREALRLGRDALDRLMGG
ncbi:MAG: hypothetical protein GWN84_13210, partial [Gammaproteobacteria bacterium]|nr:hypothetical protein [Gammaproteobacteria bacterium]NIR83788.1 hypothetical protein [Gammaproteobacteria bacterium]NIU05114.1 hypothetical protein [Gammaproteobacteria bacterium]NIV51951.1 hypothetical protein [Gammaproteobacteria bacterium]NIX86387.1 hypothetical protein [Gammaproteobacteria bacterium]